MSEIDNRNQNTEFEPDSPSPAENPANAAGQTAENGQNNAYSDGQYRNYGQDNGQYYAFDNGQYQNYGQSNGQFNAGNNGQYQNYGQNNGQFNAYNNGQYQNYGQNNGQYNAYNNGQYQNYGQNNEQYNAYNNGQYQNYGQNNGQYSGYNNGQYQNYGQNNGQYSGYNNGQYQNYGQNNTYNGPYSGYQNGQPYANPQAGYQQAPASQEPVTNIFCYILMALLGISTIVSIVYAVNMLSTTFSSIADFDLANNGDFYSLYSSMMNEIVNSVAPSPLYSMFIYLLKFAIIVFAVIDIVLAHKGGYPITGLILFAIFLKPGYFLWRAYALKQKKTIPVLFTVSYVLVYFIYFIWCFSYGMRIVSAGM